MNHSESGFLQSVKRSGKTGFFFKVRRSHEIHSCSGKYKNLTKKSGNLVLRGNYLCGSSGITAVIGRQRVPCLSLEVTSATCHRSFGQGKVREIYVSDYM